MHPPPSPAQANFTLMTECTPESRRYYSVYSLGDTIPCPVFLTNLEGKVGKVDKVGKVGKVGRVGKVGKVGKEGRLRE